MIKYEIKKIILFSFLLFLSFNIFAQEHHIGKMLIMGWYFFEDDSPFQTDYAVDAIINYAEAAKNQMTSKISNYYPPYTIELYKNVYPFNESYDGVFIYINSKSAEDYFNRFIEINFHFVVNGSTLKYKLVLYYDNYKWSEDDNEKGMWELIAEDNLAYGFFVSNISKLKRAGGGKR